MLNIVLCTRSSGQIDPILRYTRIYCSSKQVCVIDHHSASTEQRVIKLPSAYMLGLESRSSCYAYTRMSRVLPLCARTILRS